MKLYLAGPMTGLPELNFPAFTTAAEELRSLGHEVVSPHEKDLTVPGFDPARESTHCTLDMAETLRWDLRAVLDADGIVLLQGWDKSPGARLERVVAESTGRQVYLWRGQLVADGPWDHELIYERGRRLSPPRPDYRGRRGGRSDPRSDD